MASDGLRLLTKYGRAGGGTARAVPLFGMESIEAADCATAFAKELLRAGNMLYGLASNLVEGLPGDAYPDEAPEAVVIEMIIGSIRTSLGGVDQRELQRASELISGACDRVLEHLQLALELSRRMHGRADGGGGRTYGWELSAPSRLQRRWQLPRDQAAGDSAPLMRAIWRALTPNARRVARALAVVSTPLYSDDTAEAVGIKRSSIRKALEGLVASADVIYESESPRLTDPMFELWLQTRGLRPAAGEDPDLD